MQSTQSVLFMIRSLLVYKVFFEMTAGNTFEICPKFTIKYKTCN